MAEPFLAEIKMFAGNFAPRGYAFCDGQLLPIAQYSAVFSLLGTTYGGDGQTTFALPDLRSRSPVHVGGSAGPGLPNVILGQKGGAADRTLTVNNMPNHNHGGSLRVSSARASSASPVNNYLCRAEAYTGSQDANSGALAIPAQGGGQALNIQSPYLGVNFIIALVGLFPSRN